MFKVAVRPKPCGIQRNGSVQQSGLNRENNIECDFAGGKQHLDSEVALVFVILTAERGGGAKRTKIEVQEQQRHIVGWVGLETMSTS